MSETSDDHRSWWQRLTQPLVPCQPQTRKQLQLTLQQAQRRGLFSLDTLDMLEGALEVSETHVREIMVPRGQMVVLPYSGSLEDFLPIIIESGHSRFPVVGEGRDDVQGILLAKDLLPYYARGGQESFNMRDILRPPVFIPESKRLNVLLREFRTSRNHMAVVVDEYGGVAGLVTIEDVIEEIVGDIDDEHDLLDTDSHIKPRDKNRYTVRALTPLDAFNEYFHADLDTEEADTVGGILLKAFGHLPKRGETIAIGGFKFEILRSDSRRIHLLRVELLPLETPGKEIET